ncbi:MAG TPA: hypothetical protein VEP68_05360 [Anaeromyxobacteraceae bacterium]|nr:hypothetical protein [Anaeromyxobacteraceae bacterium]
MPARLLALTAAALLPAPALAGWFADFETGIAWQGYNDVRIPGDSGTLFSLTDDLDPSSAPFYRVRLGWEITDRHTVFVLFAPLRLDASGVAPVDIQFHGGTYPAGSQVYGTYRFDSYRLTYRYGLVRGQGIQVDLGLTAKIRDAAISLYGADFRVRSDTGFVPLLSFRVAWNFAGDFGLLLDGDALAGGPGRAEDVLLAVTWRLRDDLTLRAGYRFVEGGADTASVYNFALVNYAVVGLTVGL